MARCAHSAQDDDRTGTLTSRVQQVADHHLDYRRRASIRMLLAFVVTFGLIRLLTYAIHENVGPFHDITLGGGSEGSVHIHHYIWGLLLIALCGFLALSLDAARWHPVLAIPFGIGLALVLDEFALLLELRDVYWAQDGRRSVDVAVVVAALLLLYYVAQCFWRGLVLELRRGLGHIRR